MTADHVDDPLGTRDTRDGSGDPHTRDVTCADDRSHGLAERHHSVTLVLLLAILLSLQIAYFAEHRTDPPPVDSSATALDPNVAPWWELTVLPRVGESLAARIVAYRKQANSSEAGGHPRVAFRTAEDLDRVRGIGPKTVARLRPYLRFDEN